MDGVEFRRDLGLGFARRFGFGAFAAGAGFVAPATIEISAGRAAPSLDAVKRLQDLGVSRYMTAPPAFDPDGITQGLEQLGTLIAKT